MIEASDDEKAIISENVSSTENLLIATVDATIAAQNAALAAESMGLGICYIGSIRRDMDKVDQLMKLPEHVIPLFGIAIGYPDDNPEQKPRLPQKAFYFENEYANDQIQAEQLAIFDQKIEEYYLSRSTNKRTDHWTKQVIENLKKPRGARLTPYLQEKKFNKK